MSICICDLTYYSPCPELCSHDIDALDNMKGRGTLPHMPTHMLMTYWTKLFILSIFVKSINLLLIITIDLLTIIKQLFWK